MINKYVLKSKDFALVLPEMIAKIQFIGSSLINAGITKEFIQKDEFIFMYGSGLILTEIFKDLELINKALYPESEVVQNLHPTWINIQDPGQAKKLAPDKQKESE